MNKETMRKHYETTPKDILINILMSSREEVDKLQKRNKELKQEIERLNNIINKAIEYIRIYRSYQKIDNKDYLKGRDEIGCLDIYQVDELLDILNEVSE